MPKMKTRKSISKRFKKTATGKLMRQSTKMRHKLGKMDANKKRHLGKEKVTADGDVKRIIEAIPFK